MLRVRQPAIKTIAVTTNRLRFIITQRKVTMQLKQSSAATIRVGPILDSNGAAVTSAVVGDLRIIKNGVVSVMSGITITHDHNGNYLVPLDVSHTDTIGRLEVSAGNTAMQMAPERFMVLEPSIFDSLVLTAVAAAGGLRDLARINGQVVSASTGVAFPASVASETTVSDIQKKATLIPAIL